MTSPAGRKLHIALFSYSANGLYFGELINQIRSLCHMKRYRLTVIDTAGHVFDSPLGVENWDGVIILKNALHPNLARRLIEQNRLPTVSIGYDYYPLKIPIISFDQEFGAKIALEHCRKHNHNKVAFIGDLSQYDIRRRFEAVSDTAESLQMEFHERNLINVTDALFQGGKQAAEMFVDQQSDANALIFGAGLTAVGFMEKFRQLNPQEFDNLTYVCFDALSLLPVVMPNLSAIDPNLHLIAYKALGQLEAQMSFQTLPRNESVKPKLIHIDRSPKESYNEFIATCVDLPEFHNPNYMKSLIALSSDFSLIIARSNLEEMMCLSPLFKRFLKAFTLSKYHIDRNAGHWVKILKRGTEERTETIDKLDHSAITPCERFTPDSAQLMLSDEAEFSMHFCLYQSESLWGFISTYGECHNGTDVSSYFGFASYLENIRDRFTIEHLYSKFTTEFTEAEEIEVKHEASIMWDFNNSITTWSPPALAYLGFSSKVEINIYQHMEITDRIQEEFFNEVNKKIASLLSSGDSFCIKVMFHHKDGELLRASLAGSILDSPETQQKFVEFRIGVGEN